MPIPCNGTIRRNDWFTTLLYIYIILLDMSIPCNGTISRNDWFTTLLYDCLLLGWYTRYYADIEGNLPKVKKKIIKEKKNKALYLSLKYTAHPFF